MQGLCRDLLPACWNVNVWTVSFGYVPACSTACSTACADHDHDLLIDISIVKVITLNIVIQFVCKPGQACLSSVLDLLTLT